MGSTALFMPKPSAKSYAGTDGFVIVAVLWILAALAALASVYSVYLGNTAAAVRSYGARVQSSALIRAALELTAYHFIGFDDTNRPTSGTFAFQLGASKASVEFRSEGARIDLNLAPKELLSGLFVALGEKPGDADSYADRIIAWRTKPPTGAKTTEIDDYKAAGLDYGPRQAPFQSISELRLVLGLPQPVADAALPFLTIFNGQAGIDVNEAAPEVIAALPHISANVIDEVLARRDPRNPQAVLPLLGQARANVAVGGRKAVRAIVRATLEGGRSVNADTVIFIGGNGPEPYHILAWRDDFDGPI